MTRWIAAAVLVAVSWLGGVDHASAHPTPGSVAFMDFTVDGARLEQDVPIEELERALHQQLMLPGDTAEAVVRRHAAMLLAYAGQHVRATSPKQRPWRVDALDVTGHDAVDGPRARFSFALQAPEGEAGVSLHLLDDVVEHEVVSHYTAVYVRSDWAAGVVTDQPRLVGTIHAGHNDLTIKRDGGFLRGFRGIVSLGIEHIATGTDHLIFLFVLLLAAPLSAASGRWRTRRGLRDTLIALAGVVSAFTVGHSLTLALGVLGGVSLPAALVEPAIALSILVTAVHALRPLFPRREALIAGVFGLIHGLAFASSLVARDLGRAQAAWTLLGFNVGIELAQLALLALVLPWLLILSSTRAYDALRIGGASLASVLATAWFVERTLHVANPTTFVTAWMEAHPFSLLVTLAVAAVLARGMEAFKADRVRESRRRALATNPSRR